MAGAAPLPASVKQYGSASEHAAQPNADACGQQKHPSESFWERTFSDPVGAFTFGLFVATAGLWAFTALMWWYTRKAVTDSQQTSRHQLRAYVGPATSENEQGITAFPDRSGVSCIIRIKNFGLTPAKDLVVSSIITYGRHPLTGLDAEFRKTAIRSNPVILFPAETIRAGGPLEAICGWHMGHKADPALHISFIGLIEYTDFNGERRWTTFKVSDNGRCGGWHVDQDGNDYT
jgi:hypothetical protein